MKAHEVVAVARKVLTHAERQNERVTNRYLRAKLCVDSLTDMLKLLRMAQVNGGFRFNPDVGADLRHARQRALRRLKRAAHDAHKLIEARQGKGRV